MHPIVWFGPAALSLLALIDMPYGYYMFLRLVVCLSAAAIAVSTWRTATLWAAAFATLALLFNPIFRVHLDRETWQPINVVAAVLYIAHWSLLARRQVGR